MKRLHSGTILYDKIDILCLSFSFGSTLGYLFRKWKQKKNIDPLVNELKQEKNIDPLVNDLKEKSPILSISVDDKPLKLPIVRGGETIGDKLSDKLGDNVKGLKGVSLAIKNKKLAVLVGAIINAHTKRKQFKLLQAFFAILNGLLTTSLGLRVAVGGSMNYIQFILLVFPSTIAGFVLEHIFSRPLYTIFLPLAIFYGRDIENISDPSETYRKCQILCKAAEEVHNKQLVIEMKEFNSVIKDTINEFQPPIDQVPLVCVEDKISLLERYKLRKLIESDRVRKRTQHFSEFIKKFPECNADADEVYEHIIEKLKNK